MATEVDEFEQLVKSLKLVHKSLGSLDRHLSDEENVMKGTMRRSLVANQDINEGEILTSEKLTAKRPPTGISPDQMDLVVGRVASRSISKDRIIKFEDFK